MDNKGYNISVFEKGSLIIRCCAAYVPATVSEYDESAKLLPSSTNNTVTTSVVHNDFRTEPVRLVAVENGVIYLTPAQMSPAMRMLGHTDRRIYKIIHEYWQDGWTLFEVPEGLEEKECF